MAMSEVAIFLFLLFFSSTFTYSTSVTFGEFRRRFHLPRFGIHSSSFSLTPSSLSSSSSPPTYSTRWFHATLDHFNFANSQTFRLRYLIDESQFAGFGSPIFLYTGNEGDVEWFAKNTGFIWEIAPGKFYFQVGGVDSSLTVQWP